MPQLSLSTELIMWGNRSRQLGGRQKGVTPVCSDLFRFPRFLPICSDFRSVFSGIPRFAPICSDLLRFLPICCFQKEQFRTNQGNPFLPTPFANPWGNSASCYVESRESAPQSLNFEKSPKRVRKVRFLDVFRTLSRLHPDPPILAFLDFLAFFVFRFPLLFCAFSLSFPRILWVPWVKKPSFFRGFPCFFSKRQGLEGQGSAHSVATLGGRMAGRRSGPKGPGFSVWGRADRRMCVCDLRCHPNRKRYMRMLLF